jgi:cobalamin biosynthesis protein CobW
VKVNKQGGEVSMSKAKIPATIITGFLGSGKTTLLRHILDNANGRKIAVIVNEFGELGIDGDLLRGCGVGCDEETNQDPCNLYELANGCLCCTVQDEFFPIMNQLIERQEKIDHILIETSGLSLPKPLVQAFNWPEIKNACTVDAVITVVDTPATATGQFAANPAKVDQQRQSDPNLNHETALHELFEDQLSAADLVILSKTDLVSKTECRSAQALVKREIPPQVKIITSCGTGVDPALLLGLQNSAEDSIHLKNSHHDDEEEHHHDHDHFDSVVVRLPAVEREGLLVNLQKMVQEHAIFRVKGFVAVQGKPMRLVVHGVGKRFDSYYDRRWREDEMPQTHLVIIGQGLDQAQLQQTLQNMIAEPV